MPEEKETIKKLIQSKFLSVLKDEITPAYLWKMYIEKHIAKNRIILTSGGVVAMFGMALVLNGFFNFWDLDNSDPKGVERVVTIIFGMLSLVIAALIFGGFKPSSSLEALEEIMTKFDDEDDAYPSERNCQIYRDNERRQKKKNA